MNFTTSTGIPSKQKTFSLLVYKTPFYEWKIIILSLFKQLEMRLNSWIWMLPIEWFTMKTLYECIAGMQKHIVSPYNCQLIAISHSYHCNWILFVASEWNVRCNWVSNCRLFDRNLPEDLKMQDCNYCKLTYRRRQREKEKEKEQGREKCRERMWQPHRFEHHVSDAYMYYISQLKSSNSSK